MAGTVRVVVLVLAVATAGSLPALAQAQTAAPPPTASQAPTPGVQLAEGRRIALVDFRGIAEKSQLGKRVLLQLQGLQDKKTVELQALQTKIQGLQTQRQSQANVLSAAALAILDRDLDRLGRDFQRAQEDAQAELQGLRTQLMDDLQKRIGAIVTQLAKEKGIDLVLEAEVAVYFHPSLDLSDEIVRRLDASPR